MTTLRVVGYTSAHAREILATALQGGDFTAFPGDWIVVAESGAEVHIVTSIVAAHPYFYGSGDSGFLHGENVFELSRAGARWEWNARALRALAVLGHTFGEDTLHRRIRRVPPASHLHWTGSTLRVRKCSAAFDERDVAGGNDSDRLEAFLESLVAAFRELPDGPLVISLSAGLDSRLLLGLALATRRPERAVCMGGEDSTDLVIATELALRAGIPLTQVSLHARDYLEVASWASWRTGGSKTAGSWHTAIYPLKAGLNDTDVHLVGSNGEFARSFFLPQSRLGPIVLGLVSRAPARLHQEYWLAKMVRRRARFDREWSFLSGSTLTDLREDVLALQEGLPGVRDLGERLDAFYALQRVRHFIGNGLALYAANGVPCSPFLDYRWIAAARRLPRRLKLYDQAHLWCQRRLRPGDLDLPFNGKAYPRPGRPPVRVSPVRGYSVFQAAVGQKEVADRLIDDRSLDEHLPKSARERAVRSRATADLELLWTLSAASEHVRGSRTGREDAA